MRDQRNPALTVAGVAIGRRTYSVAEVAEMYGVHPSTIYREIEARRMKALRVGAKGGRVRIPAESLAEYESVAAIAPAEMAEVAA